MTTYRDSKEISYADVKKAYDNFRPACKKHRPVASLDTNEDGTCVIITCKNCGFTAWMHPDAYKEMISKSK